jgi:hypothetical protein
VTIPQPFLARFRGPVAFWAAAGVSLLVSHDAVYLAQLGPGHALAQALRAPGHDYWGTASLALVVIGAVALGATATRLHRLRRLAVQLAAGRVARSRPYAARWLAAWLRLLAVVAIGFGIQENVEHVIGHGHAPGLGALFGPEYPLALPVIAAITAVAALIAAALGQAERALLAVIADAIRRRLARAPRRTPRPPLRLAVDRAPPLALAVAGRAPPRAFVSVP